MKKPRQKTLLQFREHNHEKKMIENDFLVAYVPLRIINVTIRAELREIQAFEMVRLWNTLHTVEMLVVQFSALL